MAFDRYNSNRKVLARLLVDEVEAQIAALVEIQIKHITPANSLAGHPDKGLSPSYRGFASIGGFIDKTGRGLYNISEER